MYCGIRPSDFLGEAVKMNQIKIVMFLVLSIGWLPTAVRAEAPTPKGGCSSREVATRPLIAPRSVNVKGRVVAIERNNEERQIAARSVVKWVRLKTTTGEEKNVYLGSARALKQQGLNINVSDVLEVQGVQTNKSKQLPTIIASSIEKSDRVWKIANIADKPTGVQWCRFNG
jgi:hypothetical protein